MRARLHDGQALAMLLSAAANDNEFASVCTEPVVLRVHCAADLPEVLSLLENLFQRIQNHPSLRLWVVKDAATEISLVFVRSLDVLDSQGRQLLEAVLDQDLYRWIQLPDEAYANSRFHSLIQDITQWGDVAVIEFTPVANLARLAGEDAKWQVQGLLNRIQTTSRLGSAVVTANPVAKPAKNAFIGSFSNAMNSTSHGTFEASVPYVEQMKALKRELDALDIRNPSPSTPSQEVA